MTAQRVLHLSLLWGKFPSCFMGVEESGACPRRVFQMAGLGFLFSGLSVDVLCSLPCRRSHAEQAESGDRAPASPPPPTTKYHLPSALPAHLHDATEFPTPPPTPPERHTPEAVPTPPASPHFPPPPPPPPAPASPPAPSAYQCEDPTSAPCRPPVRYDLLLRLSLIPNLFVGPVHNEALIISSEM